MTNPKVWPQFLILFGMALILFIAGALLPGLIRADAYIDVQIDPGSQVVAGGDNATMNIVVDNTNSVTLTNVIVDDGSSCDTLSGPTGDTNTDSILDTNETWTYSCLIQNVTSPLNVQVEVNATQGDSGPGASHNDSATVDVASFDFTKTTDTPNVLPNTDVVFSLRVTNTGNVELVPVSAEDDLCDNPDFLLNPIGDTDGDNKLDISEAWSLVCAVPDVTVDFTNYATATFSSGSVQVTKHADAAVNVANPGIEISKNPGSQTVNNNGTASFNIEVTNTGDEPLSDLSVADALAASCEKTKSQLNPGNTWNYNCSEGGVQDGFVNSATVSAASSVGNVSASDAAEVILSEAAGACPSDVVSYWKLDENSGPTYDDYYSGRDGECAGTCPASEAEGRVYRSQTFDGTSTGIDVPLIAGDEAYDWEADDSFSIELWVKTAPGSCSGSTDDDNEVFIGRDHYADNDNRLHWWLGCRAPSGGKAYFHLRNAVGQSHGLVLEGPVITDQNWHHLVALRDGSGQVTGLYVDGVEAASVNYAYMAGFGSPVANLNIGWLKTKSNKGFHFRGQLDEVAIYDKALSAGEVVARYSGGQPEGVCGAPNIISEPGTFVKPEEPYTYTVAAVGTTPLSYQLLTSPPGMAFNPSTLEITWTPTTDQLGSHDVLVEVSNNAGLDTQAFQLWVSNADNRNYLPLILKNK